MTDTQFEVIGLINCDCCEEKSRGRSQPVTALQKNFLLFCSFHCLQQFFLSWTQITDSLVLLALEKIL